MGDIEGATVGITDDGVVGISVGYKEGEINSADGLNNDGSSDCSKVGDVVVKSEVGDSDGIDVSITVDVHIGVVDGQRERTVEVVAVGMNEGCAVEMEVGCIEGDICTTVGVIVGEEGSAGGGDSLVLSMEGNEDNGEIVGAYIGNNFLVGLRLGWHDGFPSGATLGRREGVRLGLLLGCCDGVSGLRDGCSVGCSDGYTCGLQLGCLVGHENG